MSRPYTYLVFYPCTLPTAPVSRSFGLRSSYEPISLKPTNVQLNINLAGRDAEAAAALVIFDHIHF